MKKNLSKISLLIISSLLCACSSGTSLEEIGKMSPEEKMAVTELNISPVPEGLAELNLGQLLPEFINLRELEIDKDFKGTLEGGGRLDNGPMVEVIKVPGVTAFGGNLFNTDWAQNLRELYAPSVVVIGSHCFGSSCDNKLTVLDLPSLRSLGGNCLIGCKNLKELKLGSDEPISMPDGAFSSYFGKVDTENIILYLGDYEYENHVDGNTWNIYWYPASASTSEELEGLSLISHTDWNDPRPNGKLTFKEIRKY